MTRAELEAALVNAIAAADRNAVNLLRAEIKTLLRQERIEQAIAARRAELAALLAQYG